MDMRSRQHHRQSRNSPSKVSTRFLAELAGVLGALRAMSGAA